MKFPSREEQKRILLQWEETGRELERIRLESLRAMPYNWQDVDALLELAALAPLPERTESGLTEMQRLFMKARYHTQAARQTATQSTPQKEEAPGAPGGGGQQSS